MGCFGFFEKLTFPNFDVSNCERLEPVRPFRYINHFNNLINHLNNQPMMQLNNVIGLCGVLMLLQLINCMKLETNFLTACVLLVLSDCDRKVKAIVPKLLRKNPMVTFTDNQFKKDFRFSKTGIPRLLECLRWPPFFSA